VSVLDKKGRKRKLLLYNPTKTRSFPSLIPTPSTVMNPLSSKESSSKDDRQSPSGDDAFPTPPSSNVSLASPAESPFPLSPAYNEQHSTPTTPSPINQPLPPNSNQSSLQTSTESPKPPTSLGTFPPYVCSIRLEADSNQLQLH